MSLTTQGRELDTDGDGNCPRHPKGCMKDPRVRLEHEARLRGISLVPTFTIGRDDGHIVVLDADGVQHAIERTITREGRLAGIGLIDGRWLYPPPTSFLDLYGLRNPLFFQEVTVK